MGWRRYRKRVRINFGRDCNKATTMSCHESMTTGVAIAAMAQITTTRATHGERSHRKMPCQEDSRGFGTGRRRSSSWTRNWATSARTAAGDGCDGCDGRSATGADFLEIPKMARGDWRRRSARGRARGRACSGWKARRDIFGKGLGEGWGRDGGEGWGIWWTE